MTEYKAYKPKEKDNKIKECLIGKDLKLLKQTIAVKGWKEAIIDTGSWNTIVYKPLKDTVTNMKPNKIFSSIKRDTEKVMEVTKENRCLKKKLKKAETIINKIRRLV